MAHVVCLLKTEADRATFTWREGPASFPPYTLDGMLYKDFQELAGNAREKLADLVKDYLQDQERVPKSAYALARAGHELYQAMFDTSADQKRQAREVRDWLEQMAGQGSVDTLEVVVDSPWLLPWNVIYDQKPDKDAFLSGDETRERWLPFWGLRYNLAGGRKVDPLRRMPLLKDPKVLMVVDPEIRDQLPEPQQQRLAEFAKRRQLKVVHSLEELEEATEDQRPDLLYWLSHAEPDALVLADERISPRKIRRLLSSDDDALYGGLAFLNACQTAEAGESSSFFEALHQVGFAGMIGTEHQTIDQFANPLGLDFLEAFLDRGEPVGSVLRQLRGRVPLGLLYGTYCPPDIRVDIGTAADQLEVRQVMVQGQALSAAPATAPRGAEPPGAETGSAEPPGAETGSAEPPQALPPLPASPYPSLSYYNRDGRALFAGRDDDVARFNTLLDEPDTRILVLHGESGVGKSSFLRAGVIPALEEDCLGYRFVRQRNEQSQDTTADSAADGEDGAVMFIRATNDLGGQLAEALCSFCATPYEYQTPRGETVAADLPGVLTELVGADVHPLSVRAALDADLSLLGQLLGRISERLPFAAVLVIDQGEEVFTLSESPEDLARGRRALDMLRRAVQATGDFKIIFSLRTEYYGRLVDRLRHGLKASGGVREYLITDFDEPALIEAISRPTATQPIPHTCEVPFEKYGFQYEEGVPEELAHRITRYTGKRRDSVLPLVQVICSQLYRRVAERGGGTITRDDVEVLGGIAGGMRSHVDGLVNQMLQEQPSDKKPLQHLFTQLYLRQPDGTLTTALLPEDDLRERWTGEMDFGELLRQCRAKRLLKVNSLRIGGEQERRYVSLGHDALAKIAAQWDDALSLAARARRTAAIIVGVVALAVVMGTLWVNAEVARHEAARQTRIARSKGLAAAALLESNDQLDLASLLAIEAWRADETVEARNALMITAQTEPRLVRILGEIPAEVLSMTVAADGTLIAGCDDGSIQLYKLADGNLSNVRQFTGLGRVRDLAMSPDGTLVALDEDGRIHRSQDLDDDPTWMGDPLPSGAPELAAGESRLTSVISTVSAGENGMVASTGIDGSIRLWRRGDGGQMQLEVIRQHEDVRCVAFGPGGLLASGSNESVQLWRVDGEAAVSLHNVQQAGYDLAWCEDKNLLAAAQTNGVQIWKVNQDGITTPAAPKLDSEKTSVEIQLAFRSDGTLAWGDGQTTVRLWRGKPLGQFELGGSSARVAFCPTLPIAGDPGGLLVTSSREDLVQTWRVEDDDQGPQPLARTIGQLPEGATVERIGPNALTLIRNANGELEVWQLNPTGIEPIGQPAAAKGRKVVGASFQKNNVLVATRAEPGSETGNPPPIQYWLLNEAGSNPVDLTGLPLDFEKIEFNDDRTLVAIQDENGGQVFRRHESEFEPVSLAAIGKPTEVVLGPDDIHAAIIEGVWIRFWRLEQHDAHHLADFDQPGNGLEFGPEGMVVVVSYATGGTLLRIRNNEQVDFVQGLDKEGDRAIGVIFGPGRLFATQHPGQLWQVWTFGKLGANKLGKPFFNPMLDPIAFGREQVLYSINGQRVIARDLRPPSLIQRNCHRANTNLAQAEWKAYVGENVPYRLTCPDVPPEKLKQPQIPSTR